VQKPANNGIGAGTSAGSSSSDGHASAQQNVALSYTNSRPNPQGSRQGAINVGPGKNHAQLTELPMQPDHDLTRSSCAPITAIGPNSNVQNYMTSPEEYHSRDDSIVSLSHTLYSLSYCFFKSTISSSKCLLLEQFCV